MFEALAQPFAEPPQALHPVTINNQIEIPKQNPPQMPQVNNYEALEKENLQLVDLFPDMADSPLNQDHFLEAINKIEQENKQLNPVQNTPTTTSGNNTITSSYIQNICHNVPAPHMYFSNSNVTINYNINQKKHLVHIPSIFLILTSEKRHIN